MNSNPLLSRNDLPRFDHIKAEHVVPAVNQVLDQQRRRLERLKEAQVEDFSWALELEDLRQAISQVFSPISHLNNVVSGKELRDAYNTCLPEITGFFTEIGQDADLLRGYQTLAESQEVRADATKKQLVTQALRDFRLAGVELKPRDKTQFRQIMQELARAQAQFEQNLMDATDAFQWRTEDRKDLDGLPDSLIERSVENAERQGVPGYQLNLDPPTYTAVMSHAANDGLRQSFYQAWVTRASDQGPHAGKWDNALLMDRILELRHQAAQLVGYDNYAAFSLATKMADSVPAVLEFLGELASRSKALAETELKELAAFAKRELEPWDLSYYGEKLKQHSLGLDEESLRPYFPLEQVFAGLFKLAEDLFDMRFSLREGVASWHPTVRFYDVTDSQGVPVGGMFVDLYARPNKRGGAWMDECLIRQRYEGTLLRPVAHLVCNFASPSKDRPALLTHRDVVTLFHEFGHTLHHLLTEVDYPSLSGINGVPWDAVELPSQFFENFAWQRAVLTTLSGHYQTGEPLPAGVIDKLEASRVFHAGIHMVRQLEFALFDFRLHAEYDPNGSGQVDAVLKAVRDEVAVLPTPSYNRFANSFAHVFGGGYAAGYYSYKWAEVLAADAYSAFQEEGAFQQTTATRFRDAILAKGGSRDILAGFVEFRGREPRLEPLLRQSGIAI